MADDTQDATPLQVAQEQPKPAPEPDAQAPSLQTAIQGSQPDTSNLQGVLNSSQPAQAQFQPTIGSRLKGVLLGLAMGGVPGAVAGGVSPTFVQQTQQNRQNLINSKIRFQDAQSAYMVAQSAVRQKDLANYDEDHQRKVFDDNLNTAEKLQQMGFTQSYTTGDDNQSEMAAMQNETATKGAVPPTLSLAVAPGQIMHFDLSNGGGQHAMYEFYAQQQRSLGKVVPTEQMFMSQNPQQRYAMFSDAAHYWNQPANAQSRAVLQSDYETLKSLPDNVAPSDRDATLAHLNQALSNMDKAINANSVAAGQAKGAETLAAAPAEATAAAQKTAAETPGKVAQAAATEQAKLNVTNAPSNQEAAARGAGMKSAAEQAAKATADWKPGATADEKKKAELAENMVFNANNIATILQRRPDIVGVIAGRITNIDQMAGTNDPDIVQMGTDIHNIAMANNGIHGMRSAEAVKEFETKVLNNFKNGPRGIAGGLMGSVNSVQTFIDNARPDTYKTHSKNGGAIKSMVPNQ